MAKASLTDMATLKRHGYKVAKYGQHGWELVDPDGYNLMIGDHGHIAPTQWEAVAEALHRIADGDHKPRAVLSDVFKDRGQHFKGALRELETSDG